MAAVKKEVVETGVADEKTHQRLVDVPRVDVDVVEPMPEVVGVVFSWQEAQELSK